MKTNLQKLLFTIACLLCSIGVYAHAFEVDGIYYNIASKTGQTVEVTFDSYDNKYTGTVEIPKSVIYNGVNYSVTSIGRYAFYECTGLTKVTIPNSVTSIGDYAFDECSGLTEVTIGNSVTSIGKFAFYKCTGLTEISIPNSVTSIGDYAFSGCSGLTEVTIPNSVTSIGESAFDNCRGLTEVTIGNSVTSIGNSAFYNCTGLTEVTIGNSVTSIGMFAFRGCNGLTSIAVEEGNVVYDSRENCNAIIETATNNLIVGCKNSIIPNSVTSIGEGAFAVCTGLTEVTIPNSVTSIGEGAFAVCTGLTEVTIPSSVTSIGSSAFSGCTGLTEITIPESIISIGDYTFSNCTGLTEISIPNSVTSIGEGAFYYCTRLTAVTIPNSVTSIGRSAFEGCTGLTEVHSLATTPPTISRYTFSNYSAMLYVPVESMDAYKTADYWKAFRYINKYFVDGLYYNILSTTDVEVTYKDNNYNSYSGIINIPETIEVEGVKYSVTSIDDYAFSGCSGLTEITIPESVTSIGSSAFEDCTVLTSIVVDKDNQAYDSRDNCNAIIKTVTNTLIAGCKNSIIPNSVTLIGDEAFYDCSGLTDVTIPNSVTSIGYKAFYGCTGLKTLISEAIVPPTIEYNTFEKANADIYISYRSSDAYKATSWGNLNLNFITKIIDDVCYVATNIADREAGITGVADKGVCTVVLPDSILQDSILHDTFRVTSIEADAFKDCIDLDEIVVSNSVEYIGNSAFEGCTGLRTVTIGSGVNEIGEKTFAGCDRIKTVNCYAEVPPTIYSNTFTVYTNDNATLHIVKGCKEDYSDANYWEYFLNITDDLTADVEDIMVDTDNTPAEYYDLNGFRVKNPTHGIYIMKQGNTVRKVVL